MDLDRYRVAPDKAIRLADHDPRDTSAFDGDKNDAEDPLDEAAERLADLQHLLYAQREERVLLVLQGMDTSGKDGTLRRVFREVGPLGVQVANFKAPSEEEKAHDYLWRVHQQTPAAGSIVVFNRSHYEDVLVVRVHEYVSIERIDKRYSHINDFERMLADEGVTIVKCFLHISKDEQRERLQARVDDPKKRWKFNEGDLDERKLWDAYQDAFELALERCSTEWAPWYVIPSDRKWYRNLVVTELLCQTLEGLKMKWPEPEGVAGTKVV